MSIEHCVQEQGIRICRLETPDIERRRKVVNENAFADADRTVELIIIEKTAPAARYQRGLVAEQGQRMRETAVEAAGPLFEEIIGARTETRAGKTGQQAEFRLPRAAPEDVNVQAPILTVRRGQECLNDRLDRQSKRSRIEDRFVLDDDDVSRLGGARRHAFLQGQRLICDVTQSQPPELPPRSRINE